MDAVKFTQAYSEAQSINAAHNLPPVDVPLAYTDALEIEPGTVLKDNAVTGAKEPWIQGTDNVNTITGVCAAPHKLNTSRDTIALVRIFGPVKKSALKAWTAADGSTVADADHTAIAALQGLFIFAMSLAFAMFGLALFMSGHSDAGAMLAILPGISLTGVNELFRPERVAQVILGTQHYGTPVLDRFYPEERRQAWNQVLVPRSKITSITRAVPVVLRGAPGIAIGGDSGFFEYIEPQPIKTYDSIAAVEFNNAALAGMESLQQWANDRVTRKHLVTHRFTTEALAAQSLSGTITFPIANQTGAIIDTYTVAFGTVGAYTVSADWSADATSLATIYQDLKGMKRQLARAGYNGSQVLVGETIFAALLDKVNTITNDTRMEGRLQDDGSIRIGEFILVQFDAEYYHPGGVGGNPAAGYIKVIGDVEVYMYDPNAPWTLLRVKIDNFKMPEVGPLGIITEISKDGSVLEVFAESKPFPIPVPEATILTDATAP